MTDLAGQAVHELEAILARADELHRQSEHVIERSRGEISSGPTVTAGLREAPAYKAVSIQPRSANPKLAPQTGVRANSGRNRWEPAGPYCASTYTSIAATCPSSCPFRDNGCFAQAGSSHLTMGDLDRAGRATTALQVSEAEAAKLEGLWVRGVPQDGHRGGRDLRLHVGGDVSCEAGARALAGAVAALQARGLGACWTYTHRWREIPRSAWGPISVFASCETTADVLAAWSRGYEAAITVASFAGRRSFDLAPGVRAIACPFEGGPKPGQPERSRPGREQNGRSVNKSGVRRNRPPTCVECRLCLGQPLRSRGRLIAFAAHGKDAGKAREQLAILRG